MLKATGIVRRIDELGRIVLPKELRRTYDIGPGDHMEVYTDDDSIILKKYKPGCIICGESNNDDLDVKGVTICRSCAEKIAAAAGKKDQ